jgi:hypothetical protein
MEYVRVADSSELASGQTKKVLVDGYEILLVNADGALYALACLPNGKGGRNKTPLQMLVDGSELYVALPDSQN